MKTSGKSIVLTRESFFFASFSSSCICSWPTTIAGEPWWFWFWMYKKFFKWDEGAYEVDKLARPTSILFVTSPWYDSEVGFLERDAPLPWTRAVHNGTRPYRGPGLFPEPFPQAPHHGRMPLGCPLGCVATVFWGSRARSPSLVDNRNYKSSYPQDLKDFGITKISKQIANSFLAILVDRYCFCWTTGGGALRLDGFQGSAERTCGTSSVEGHERTLSMWLFSISIYIYISLYRYIYILILVLLKVKIMADFWPNCDDIILFAA